MKKHTVLPAAIALLIGLQAGAAGQAGAEGSGSSRTGTSGTAASAKTTAMQKRSIRPRCRCCPAVTCREPLPI